MVKNPAGGPRTAERRVQTGQRPVSESWVGAQRHLLLAAPPSAIRTFSGYHLRGCTWSAWCDRRGIGSTLGTLTSGSRWQVALSIDFSSCVRGSQQNARASASRGSREIRLPLACHSTAGTLPLLRWFAWRSEHRSRGSYSSTWRETGQARGVETTSFLSSTWQPPWSRGPRRGTDDERESCVCVASCVGSGESNMS